MPQKNRIKVVRLPDGNDSAVETSVFQANSLYEAELHFGEYSIVRILNAIEERHGRSVLKAFAADKLADWSPVD